ncbi:AfsR/SARP family transcriptional regulator [Amycolatopsis jejuensis]|uniref:AfsR/SARP family transcriptional regulator n=1 Tax=Amycolatopsis jejuensis TaxID=330084 RepID=UPI00068F42E5|nr:AfsR/SARP family transcriptional regulator [Amycolatopsis jejuensis]
MEIRLLGPLTAGERGRPLELGGARQQVVLAALALRANEAVSLGYLMQAVWDEAPRSAESNLRTYVQRLRKLLGGPRLCTRSPGYVLVAGPGEVDVARFEELATQGEAARDRGDLAEAIRLFGAALDLWRGRPLEGLSPGPELRATIAWLEERRRTVVEAQVAAQLETGDYHGALLRLRPILAEYPLREGLWGQLMRALHGAGRRAEALEAYQEIRQLLRDELGVEPGPGLRRVQQSVLEAGSSWRDLPMDIATFTGREPELRMLHKLAEATDGTAATVVTIEGMSGVGKTRLAVRAAHQIVASGLFGEVQLYADLQGFTADHPPVAPGAVLESLLRKLGVAGERIPGSLGERASLFRDRLAGKSVLLVLDNAVDEQQVRALLPGSSHALVLITSRRSLAGLDGSVSLPLDVFTAEEAVTLIGKVIGRQRLDRAAAQHLAEQCGRLPIAVALAAKRLQTRPAWAVADFAQRLASGQLSQLALGDRAVTAAFDLSYRALSESQQRLFRLLSVNPGEDVTRYSAAALAGISSGVAESGLEDLLDEHLLQQTQPGRYRLHALLRTYAAAQAEPDGAALERLLTWWLGAARVAAQAVDPHRPVLLDAVDSVGEIPGFADRGEAMQWFEQERGNLVSAVQAAARQGFDVIALQLPRAMFAFLHLRSYRDDWVATHRIALAAAQRLGNRRAEGDALSKLGVVYSDIPCYADAFAAYRQALVIQEEIGDHGGQAWTLNNLGVGHAERGEYDEALPVLRQALELFCAVGDQRGEGYALNNLGDTYRGCGLFAEAAGHLERALELQRAIGDRIGERYTRYSLGALCFDRSRYPEAREHYEVALEINRTLADDWGIAQAQAGLGRVLHGAGDLVGARTCWQAALPVLERLGGPKAAEIRARLAETEGA